MIRVPIGDLVEPVASANPASLFGASRFTYIDIASVSQVTKAVEGPQEMPGADAPSRARQIVEPGDVLVSTVRPNLNAVAKLGSDHAGAVASTGFTVLRAKTDHLDQSYLFHWVQSPDFIADMVRKASGQSYPAVSDRIVKASEIPLPPLAEQKRIAAILDQAARLTRLRAETRARLDTLGQAIFHEMFGDGAKRITVSLSEVISVRSSLDDPRKEENMLLPHVGPEHIGAGSGFIRWDEVRTCKEDGLISGKYHFDKGDILFSKIRPYLNKVAISDRQGMCSADMYAITVAPERATTDYVHFVLGSGMFLNYAATVSNRANIPKLNRGQLLAFECPLPSLQEQEQFSLKMFVLKKQAAKGFQAATAAQTLFSSLQHRAFRGEL